MSNHAKHVSKKSGLPPGTLIHVGKRKTEEVRITVIDYTETDFTELECGSIEECLPYRDKKSVSWINIDGLHDTDTISKIGEMFDLHPLLLEDVLNTYHRPKVEEFDDYIFLTLKMLGINPNSNNIVSEQVSFVLGNNWVISFQEQQGDIFDGLRQRIKEGKGVIRQKGVDYLLYRLVDTIVDNYFYITEHIGEITEELEEQVMIRSEEEVLRRIQRTKKQLINFRKSVLPLREAVGYLNNDNTPLIKKTTSRFMRDVYEHIIQVSDSIDTHRDMVGSIMDLYLSGLSNKMNQVMQVLTIIATIFIPLTFIAGIYGMNFDYMPELHWKYGYFGVWGIMGAVLLIMIVYFRKKKWL